MDYSSLKRTCYQISGFLNKKTICFSIVTVSTAKMTELNLFKGDTVLLKVIFDKKIKIESSYSLLERKLSFYVL